MPNKRVIFFDLDDTLMDDSYAMSCAVEVFRTHIGDPRPADKFHAVWRVALDRHFARYLAGEVGLREQRRDRVREVMGVQLPDDDVDRVYASYLGAYESSWRLFPDALTCLDALSHHRLGVVTNGNTEQQRRKLASVGILDRFQHVIVSEAAGCAKPDARMWRGAGCDLTGAAHIGDNFDADVVGASSAGIRAIWLDRNRTGRKVPRDVTVIHGLGGLPELLA